MVASAPSYYIACGEFYSVDLYHSINGTSVRLRFSYKEL